MVISKNGMVGTPTSGMIMTYTLEIEAEGFDNLFTHKLERLEAAVILQNAGHFHLHAVIKSHISGDEGTLKVDFDDDSYVGFLTKINRLDVFGGNLASCKKPSEEIKDEIFAAVIDKSTDKSPIFEKDEDGYLRKFERDEDEDPTAIRW